MKRRAYIKQYFRVNSRDLRKIKFFSKMYRRPVMMWRACELLWKRKSYTDRLYALTPDHINFHKGEILCYVLDTI